MLGIPDDGGKKNSGKDSTPDDGVNPIQPPNVTDNPFSYPTDNGTTNSRDNDPGGGIAYGSIPLISDYEPSVDFLLQKLIAAAEESARAQDGDAVDTAKFEKTYRDYARNLAKTLSHLSQKRLPVSSNRESGSPTDRWQAP